MGDWCAAVFTNRTELVETPHVPGRELHLSWQVFMKQVITDPITGHRHELYRPAANNFGTWGARWLGVGETTGSEGTGKIECYFDGNDTMRIIVEFRRGTGLLIGQHYFDFAGPGDQKFFLHKEVRGGAVVLYRTDYPNGNNRMDIGTIDVAVW